MWRCGDQLAAVRLRRSGRRSRVRRRHAHPRRARTPGRARSATLEGLVARGRLGLDSAASRAAVARHRRAATPDADRRGTRRSTPRRTRPCSASIPVIVLVRERGRALRVAIEPHVVFDASAGPILVQRAGRTFARSRESTGRATSAGTCTVHGRRHQRVLDRRRLQGSRRDQQHRRSSATRTRGTTGSSGHSYLGRWVNLGAGTIDEQFKEHIWQRRAVDAGRRSRHGNAVPRHAVRRPCENRHRASADDRAPCSAPGRTSTARCRRKSSRRFRGATRLRTACIAPISSSRRRRG